MVEQSKNIMEGVLTVMIVVFIVAISALIIGTFLDNTIFESRVITGTNVNESLGAVTNVTNVTFDIISTQSGASCSSELITNATGGETLAGGNYTFFPSDCKLILTNVSNYIGSTLNATYNFAYDSNISVAGVDVNQIREDFGLFVTGLIAFLAIIGTIIGIVWLVFYIRQLFDKKNGLQSITA